ncbi:MAG: DUF167 family protein [Rhodospirillaceae bacterium]|nr:DUF167 family protein [Rhodospirillaceae bacterium]
MTFYRRASGGITLTVRATSKASADKVDGVAAMPEGPALKIKVGAPPDKGKANAAICALLARALGVPKSAVTISSGATDRRKVVAVTGDPDALIAIAQQWTTP